MMYLLYFLSFLGIIFIALIAALVAVIAYDMWRGRKQQNLIPQHWTKHKIFED